jgi:tetratricopeptide (TPR) repeat protein
MQMLALGTASGQPDAVAVFGAQLFNVRYQQGRAGEIVEQLVEFAGEPDSPGGWRAVAALALIEGGRADEARELALAENFQSVPRDWVWSITLAAWATVCSRLHLVDRAGELYELLKPFSSQLAVAGAYVSGSIPWTLGTLAATLERYEEAESYFTAAAEIEERLGVPLFLARTQAAWARALIARGRPGDLDRAQTMLEQAEGTAARLGGGFVTREVAECRAALLL